MFEIRSPHEGRMRAAYVRASLCAPVSCPYASGAYVCPVSAGHTYAHALLAIGALGESVSLPHKTTPGR
jgi:hypothetical protein